RREPPRPRRSFPHFFTTTNEQTKRQMRDLSTRMIEAVLGGEGLTGVAELAAAEAGGPVAIVLPARGLTASAPDIGELNGLAAYASSRVAGEEVTAPDEVEAAEPVVA